MNKRYFWLAVPAGLGTLIIFAAASMISLVGSDSAPYEKTFSTFCYSNVKITAPLESGGTGNDFKVQRVVVTGDFSACQGHTILLEAQMNTSQESYAFYIFTGEELSVGFDFDTGNGDGDWYKRYPQIVNSQLVANGPLTPPSAKLRAEDISWVIRFFW